jgi:hypothetical protein
MHTRQLFGVAVLGLAVLLYCATGRAEAGVISWATAQGISGDTDVDTTGTLVGALHLDGAARNETVNGVTFVGLNVTSTSSSGPFSFSFSGASDSRFGIGSTNSPYSNLPNSYALLLSSNGGGGYGSGNGSPYSLTISGLKVGHTYEFEWWNNRSLGSGTESTTATAGNSISLSSNTTGAEGGVGQFAIGTFTADASSEVISFTGGDFDALQLRDLGSAATGAPEPASLTLLATGALGLLGYAWRRRKQAAA